MEDRRKSRAMLRFKHRVFWGQDLERRRGRRRERGRERKKDRASCNQFPEPPYLRCAATTSASRHYVLIMRDNGCVFAMRMIRVIESLIRANLTIVCGAWKRLKNVCTSREENFDFLAIVSKRNFIFFFFFRIWTRILIDVVLEQFFFIEFYRFLGLIILNCN